MGKFMKKGQITTDVAVMVNPPSSSLGVRTRARTLASLPNPELSYLQLRSRRLEKPTPVSIEGGELERASSRTRVGRVDSRFTGGPSISKNCEAGSELEGRFGHSVDEFVSVGENNLDFDPTQRLARSDAALTSRVCDSDNKEFVSDSFEIGWRSRESTPCSLMRDANAISTPVSTSRPTRTAAANQRDHIMQRAIPTTLEMEEFFAGFEHHQHESFLQKYNYDIVNDVPLPGRYEWVRVDN